MSAYAGSALEYPLAPRDPGRTGLVRQLALDLHDGPTQYLCAAMLQLQRLTGSLDDDPAADPELRSALWRLGMLVERAAGELRGVVDALGGGEGVGGGIVDLLGRVVREHAAYTGMEVEVEMADDLPDPPAAARLALFRVLQEALSNAYRHSGAASATVRVGSVGMAGRRELWIAVEDDGCGFDPAGVPSAGHVGLAGMRERMRMVGGHLAVWSAIGGGTMIRATVEVP